MTQEPRPKNQPQISREKENRLSRLIDKRKVEKSKKYEEKGETCEEKREKYEDMKRCRRFKVQMIE